MKRALVLGPSLWDPARGRPPWQLSPLDLRRRVAVSLGAAGLQALLLEDLADDPYEDLMEKFRAISLGQSDAIVALWPPRARMQTTLDELVLLRAWREQAPALWILHHCTVARPMAGRLQISEKGGRSRYLDTLAGLPLQAVDWMTLRDLRDRAVAVAAELAAR